MKKTKVRLRRINWRDLIFHLHNPRISEAYTLFTAKHPKMSFNRCAYYVLKKNYSTTFLQAWRDVFRTTTMSIPEIIDAVSLNVF